MRLLLDTNIFLEVLLDQENSEGARELLNKDAEEKNLQIFERAW